MLFMHCLHSATNFQTLLQLKVKIHIELPEFALGQTSLSLSLSCS